MDDTLPATLRSLVAAAVAELHGDDHEPLTWAELGQAVAVATDGGPLAVLLAVIPVQERPPDVPFEFATLLRHSRTIAAVETDDDTPTAPLTPQERPPAAARLSMAPSPTTRPALASLERATSAGSTGHGRLGFVSHTLQRSRGPAPQSPPRAGPARTPLLKPSTPSVRPTRGAAVIMYDGVSPPRHPYLPPSALTAAAITLKRRHPGPRPAAADAEATPRPFDPELLTEAERAALAAITAPPEPPELALEDSPQTSVRRRPPQRAWIDIDALPEVCPPPRRLDSQQRLRRFQHKGSTVASPSKSPAAQDLPPVVPAHGPPTPPAETRRYHVTAKQMSVWLQ